MNSHGITMAELLKQVRQAELGERTTVGPKVKVSEDELTDPNATGDDPELLKGIKKKLDPKKDKGDGKITIGPNMEAKGAGEEGTTELVNQYKKQTPGQAEEVEIEDFDEAMWKEFLKAKRKAKVKPGRSLNNEVEIEEAGSSIDKMQVPGMFGSQPSIAQAEKKAKEKKPVDRTKEFQDEDREHRQKDPEGPEDDEGWYAHREIHGKAGISKDDWKKGWRLNSKGERVYTSWRNKTNEAKAAYSEPKRQLKDPEKEMMVKHDKTGVKVIDRKDFKRHQAAGYFEVESVQREQFKEEAQMDTEELTEQDIAFFDELFEDAVNKKAEDIIQGMKKNKDYFDKKYGDRADNVMYATANKLAREEIEIECIEALDQLDESTEQRDITEAIPSLNEIGPAIAGAARAAPYIARGAKAGWKWLKGKFKGKGKKQTGSQAKQTGGSKSAAPAPAPAAGGGKGGGGGKKTSTTDPATGAKIPATSGAKVKKPSKIGKAVKATAATTAAVAGAQYAADKISGGKKKEPTASANTKTDKKGPVKDSPRGSDQGGAATKGSETAKKPEQSFKQAFAAARKSHGGAGGQFTWKGKKYQTNVKGEKYSKNPTPVGGKKPGAAADSAKKPAGGGRGDGAAEVKTRKADAANKRMAAADMKQPNAMGGKVKAKANQGSGIPKNIPDEDKPKSETGKTVTTKKKHDFNTDIDTGKKLKALEPGKRKTKSGMVIDTSPSAYPQEFDDSYDPGNVGAPLTSAEVYANHITEQLQLDETMSMKVKMHPSGKHYEVKSVGSKLKRHGGIKVGEKLSDTEIDDAGEVGIEVQHEAKEQPSHASVRFSKGLYRGKDGKTKRHPAHQKKKLDPVGQEDPDVDNDGDVDNTDNYLRARRQKVQKAIIKHMTSENAINEKGGMAYKLGIKHEPGKAIPKDHSVPILKSKPGKVDPKLTDIDNPDHVGVGPSGYDKAKSLGLATDDDERHKMVRHADVNKDEKKAMKKAKQTQSESTELDEAKMKAVAQHMDDGKSDSEIAMATGVSRNTIKSLRKQYQQRLGVQGDKHESYLGTKDSSRLNGGKSLDPRFNSSDSHIDYHHRRSGGHQKSGGDVDQHRFQVAKKLGYKVEMNTMNARRGDKTGGEEPMQKLKETQGYADFISSQNRMMSPSNARSSTKTINEDEKRDELVIKHTEDMDAEHIHSPSDKEHIYVGGQHSRDEHTYHVHNSGTGETHTIALDHGGQDVYSAKEVHQEGKGKISRAAAHHIHKDHAKEMSYLQDE